MKEEQANYMEGKTHMLCFRPHIKVFHLNKLLVPSIQIGIQMNFNQPNLFLNEVALHGRITAADVKVKPLSSENQPLCLQRLDAKHG